MSRSKVVQFASKDQSQYEQLRRKALEGDGDLEVAFIERQGLAAWMKQALDYSVSSSISADIQIQELEQAKFQGRELIIVLANLVLGKRREG